MRHPKHRGVPSRLTEMGYFGNIWVRMHWFELAGDIHNGHIHHFDHVTLVVRGRVRCEVEEVTTEFTAPTFIVIKKDKWHKFTALEDDTVYYCIYALRDMNGEITDVYSGDNSPYDPKEHSTTRRDVEQIMEATCITCGGCEVADGLRLSKIAG